jgi:hypothetical protein
VIVNAIVQALSHVTPIRNYFLLLSDDNDTNNNNEAENDTTITVSTSPLVQSFSLLSAIDRYSCRRLADDGGE